MEQRKRIALKQSLPVRGLSGLGALDSRVLEPKMRNRGSIRGMKPVSVRRCRAPEATAH
jgi:hypothetical protein